MLDRATVRTMTPNEADASGRENGQGASEGGISNYAPPPIVLRVKMAWRMELQKVTFNAM